MNYLLQYPLWEMLEKDPHLNLCFQGGHLRSSVRLLTPAIAHQSSLGDSGNRLISLCQKFKKRCEIWLPFIQLLGKCSPGLQLLECKSKHFHFLTVSLLVSRPEILVIISQCKCTRKLVLFLNTALYNRGDVY